MEILPTIIADGAALYLAEAKTLILSDLHIGYEEERRSRGLLLPQEQKRFFQEELERLFSTHEIGRVILDGDIKHEFGRISGEEWRDVQEFIKNIQARGAKVLAVGGNHDTMIKPILDRFDIELKKSIIMKNGKKDVLIIHGDVTLEELVERGDLESEAMKAVHTVICGHEHPAMRITDGLRTETVKCFLIGKRKLLKKRREIIVMPSWNPLTFGTDVLRERPLGPLLDSFGNFSAFAVVGLKVLAFGNVETLQRL